MRKDWKERRARFSFTRRERNKLIVNECPVTMLTLMPRVDIDTQHKVTGNDFLDRNNGIKLTSRYAGCREFIRSFF